MNPCSNASRCVFIGCQRLKTQFHFMLERICACHNNVSVRNSVLFDLLLMEAVAYRSVLSITNQIARSSGS